MSYFSRHMEDIPVTYRVEIYKENDRKQQIPVISFFMDENEDIHKLVEKVLNKEAPNWKEEKEKFKIKIIHPDEDE